MAADTRQFLRLFPLLNPARHHQSVANSTTDPLLTLVTLPTDASTPHWTLACLALCVLRFLDRIAGHRLDRSLTRSGTRD